MLYSIVLFSLSPIAVICFILSFYCILFHSPAVMSRYYKLTLYFQSSTASLSTFLLTAGSHPIVLSPCLAGYPIGFLNYVMSTDHQTAFQVCLISYTIGSNIFLFYLRYEALNVESFIKKHSTLRYLLFFFYIYTFYVIITLVAISFRLENKEKERENCLKIYKGDLQKIYNERTIFLAFFRTGIPCAFFLITIIYVISMYAVGIAFFGALTQKALTRVRTHISVQSLRKQAVIINVLYTQTIIQVVFVSIPLCFLAFLFVSEADISNESHNYSIAVMAAANVVGPAYVLYTIPDYRKAIIGLPKGFSKSDIQTITRSS